uniref:Putative syntaxin 7 n=1 Tax=Corethrella appendiculata TaxID=1370023 RepID=U5EM41_9DIPT
MSYSSFDNSDQIGTNKNSADFQKMTQTITTSIQKILQNVTSMQRMVNQFGTAQDSPELKQQLRQIHAYTQQLITDTDNLLNDLVNCNERHLKIQRDRLVDEFTAAITVFQSIQRKMAELEKKAIREARSNNVKLSMPPGSKNNSSSGSGNFNSSSAFEDNFISSNHRQQQEQIQEEIDLEALENQERAIRELEDNISSVNEIYKKLGSLVYEQSHTVDSIEASVEQTSVFVHEGTTQLKKASQLRNKVRRKKVFLAAILAFVLIVIITIIWWQSS